MAGYLKWELKGGGGAGAPACSDVLKYSFFAKLHVEFQTEKKNPLKQFLIRLLVKLWPLCVFHISGHKHRHTEDLALKRPSWKLQLDLLDMTVFIWANKGSGAWGGPLSLDVTTLRVWPFRCQHAACTVLISSTWLSAVDERQSLGPTVSFSHSDLKQSIVHFGLTLTRETDCHYLSVVGELALFECNARSIQKELDGFMIERNFPPTRNIKWWKMWICHNAVLIESTEEVKEMLFQPEHCPLFNILYPWKEFWGSEICLGITQNKNLASLSGFFYAYNLIESV